MTAVAALVFSPAAFGAYSPSLTITRNVDSLSGNATVDISFGQSASDVPTARLVLLSPFPFEGGSWNVPGTRVGTVDGAAAGTITVEDPSSPVAQTAAEECTGRFAHTSIWR